MSGLNGISAYQQASQVWSQSAKKKEEVSKNQNTSGVTVKNSTTSDNNIKKSSWSPIDTKGPLMPSEKEGVGMSIGDVQLSDKAKDYYAKLKAKYQNMEFIAVSQDMKGQVHANAAAYGNARKQVVLIDDAKLEQMANDESFRKKYEGIIAMASSQLENAKNSLASSGAAVKNFGISVNADGSTSFFATLEKSSADQTKRLEKKQEEKKADKVKEKKQAEKKAEKKAKEEKLEKTRQERKAEKKEREEKLDGDDEAVSQADNKEYIELEADSMDELIDQVNRYAFDNSSRSVMTEKEMAVGRTIDFKG